MYFPRDRPISLRAMTTPTWVKCASCLGPRVFLIHLLEYSSSRCLQAAPHTFQQMGLQGPFLDRVLLRTPCLNFFFLLLVMLCHHLLYINMLNGLCSFLPFKIEEPESSWCLLYSHLVGAQLTFFG